jgi:hypothetical protein
VLGTPVGIGASGADSIAGLSVLGC